MRREEFRQRVHTLTDKEKAYQENPELSVAFFRIVEKRSAGEGTGKQRKPLVLPEFILMENRELMDAHASIVAGQTSDVGVYHDLRLSRQTRYSVVPLHMHDYVEMNYVYEGHATTVLNGQEIPLSQGSVTILDRGAIHTVRPLGKDDVLLNFQMSQRLFSPAFFNRISSASDITRFIWNAMGETRDHNHYLIMQTDGVPVFRELVENMFCEYLDPGTCTTGLMASYVDMLFILLVRCFQGQKESQYRDNNRGYVTEVLRYLEEHCADCTLTAVAARFGYNPSYLSRMLHSVTGHTFKQIVTRARLTQAATALVLSDDSICAIGLSSGYKNQSLFYEKFRERFGCTPGEWRKRSRAGNQAVDGQSESYQPVRLVADGLGTKAASS